MKKTVIFVEGQTELIFVREFLLTFFNYDGIALECFTLFSEGKHTPTEYCFPNDAADNYYQIVNVGNDKGVLSRMLRREKHLIESGFTKIIGLRDMYSQEYKEIVKNGKIDLEVNQQFINGVKSQIKLPYMYFCYAIMEIESWLLGIGAWINRFDSKLTDEYLVSEFKYSLIDIDPEVDFFHPSKKVEKIFALVDKNYNKSKGDIHSIVSLLKTQDYTDFLHSSKCKSFKEFYYYLFECPHCEVSIA